MKKLATLIFTVIAMTILAATAVYAEEFIITADQFSTVGMLETATKTVEGHTFVYSSPDTSNSGSAFSFNYNANLSMSKYTYAKVSYYCNSASDSAELRWDYAKAVDSKITLEADGNHYTVIIPLKSGLADKNTLLQFLPFGTAKANTLDANAEFGLEYLGLFATLEEAEAYGEIPAETDAEQVLITAEEFTYSNATASDTRISGHDFKKITPDTSKSGTPNANINDFSLDAKDYRYAKIGYRSDSDLTGYLLWNYKKCSDDILFENTNLAYNEVIVKINNDLTGTKSMIQLLPFGSKKANTFTDPMPQFHLEYVALFGNTDDAEEFSIDPVYYVTSDENTRLLGGVSDGKYASGDITFDAVLGDNMIVKQASYTVDGEKKNITAENGIFTISEEDVNGDIDIKIETVQGTYTISWYNDNSELIDTTKVNYGEIPTHADAVKEQTDEYTYTFSGWAPELSEATEDTSYTAVFTSEKRKYLVTWLDEDDSVIKSEDVEYGTIPSCDAPVKAEDDKYTYSFGGWDKEITAVTGEISYKASYISTRKTYTVTYTLNGTQTTVTIGTGEAVTLPEITDEIKATFVPENADEPVSAYTFFWRYVPDTSLLTEFTETNGYYAPGTEYIPDANASFIGVWVYTGAQLTLVDNRDKANALDHEFVFDIYLYSEAINTVTEFESGEFTVGIATENGTKYTYELIPNTNITFEPNLDGRVLVKRANGDVPYLTPESYDGGYRIMLGSIKVTGAGKGTVSLTNAVAYRHVVAGTDSDNLAVEVYVRDAVAEYTVEVPTAKLELTVDFKNAVNDNTHSYQDMTLTVSGGDLEDSIIIALGNDTPEVIVDMANRDGEKVTANGITDNKYVVTLENILAANRMYTVTIKGAGYRTYRYNVTMTADKQLYFWNNVMDNTTYVEEGKKGENVTFLAGDIVKDGSINIYDLSAVVSYFGEEGLSTKYNPEHVKYDLNRDGKIDSRDVAYVLVSWGM